MSEFDIFSRDDLISEIKAMRLKWCDEVDKKVAENTIQEKEELHRVIDEYVDATNDYLNKSLSEINSLYLMLENGMPWHPFSLHAKMYIEKFVALDKERKKEGIKSGFDHEKSVFTKPGVFKLWGKK